VARHYDVYVPDEGPEDAKILLVGEAPGADEHEQRRPFIGRSGDLLTNVLERNGLSRAQVRLANLCHYRPYDNKFENLLGSVALKQGVEQLHAWIKEHRPVVIVPLGAWPLRFLTGKDGIMKWRGSILSYINDDTIKVIPTVHPAAVLRKRDLYPTFDIDMKRIVEDSQFREKRLPQREYILDPRGLELEKWTHELEKAPIISCDIETVKSSSHILCVGFSPDPSVGVVITPSHAPGHIAIQRILMAKNRKVFQNGTFDTIQMINLNGYQFNDSAFELARPYYWDTMIAQHVQAPELPRALDYLTSVYTREPYYKSTGRGNIPGDQKAWSAKQNREELYEYNAKDACVTLEIALKQIEEIESDPIASRRMQFEMEQLVVAHHIANAGMYRDEVRKNDIEKALFKKWAKLQFILNGLTGYETNVHSPKLKNILYDKDKVGLPARYNRDGRMTTDEDAIVSLIAFCKGKLEKVTQADAVMRWTVRLKICETILLIRGYRKLLSSYIRPPISSDGRVRSTYKVAGTETGRWSASKFVDGTGINAQTNPRDPIEIDASDLTTSDDDVTLLVAESDVDLIVNDEAEEEVA